MRIRSALKPSPAFYHFALTHFRWLWDIVNSTFLRDTLMRLVLTSEWPGGRGGRPHTGPGRAALPAERDGGGCREPPATPGRGGSGAGGLGRTPPALPARDSLSCPPPCSPGQPHPQPPHLQLRPRLHQLGVLRQPQLLHPHPPAGAGRLPHAHGDERYGAPQATPHPVTDPACSLPKPLHLRLFRGVCAKRPCAVGGLLCHGWGEPRSQSCRPPAGPVQLPDARLVAERFLLRKTFQPDPQGSNLMFAFFAQHFTHQFFKTAGKMGHGFTRALGHGVRAGAACSCCPGTEGQAAALRTHPCLRLDGDGEGRGGVRTESGTLLQVDLGNIYGDNLERQNELRLFQDGKLKYQVRRSARGPPAGGAARPKSPCSQGWGTSLPESPSGCCCCCCSEQALSPGGSKARGGQRPPCPASHGTLLSPQLVDGEMYPPRVLEAPVHMIYPKHVPPAQRWAVGQEVFGLLPGLLMYATLWLREHNRVCDVLRGEHPTWGDEQLFQTARLILIGARGGGAGRGPWGGRGPGGQGSTPASALPRGDHQDRH